MGYRRGEHNHLNRPIYSHKAEVGTYHTEGLRYGITALVTHNDRVVEVSTMLRDVAQEWNGEGFVEVAT